MVAQRRKSGIDAVAREHITDPHAAACRLVFVTGTNDAPGGSKPGAALAFLAHQIQRAMVREQDVGAIGHHQVRPDIDPERLHLSHFRLERHGVDHEAGSENAQHSFVQDPGWNQVQDQLPLIANDGVAGVVAAVEASHDLEGRGDQVDDLPLAFVTPLAANDCNIRHRDAGRALGS
jgi:hypothetical protein